MIERGLDQIDASDRAFAERLLSRVWVGDDCWEWDGHVCGGGYGQIWYKDREVLAHRASAMLFGVLKSASDGLVLHRCDNRTCVRPDHLWVGTHGDNSADCVTKGRHRSANGEKTRCKNGHAFDAANTYVHPVTGHRTCRACRNACEKRRKA